MNFGLPKIKKILAVFAIFFSVCLFNFSLAFAGGGIAIIVAVITGDISNVLITK